MEIISRDRWGSKSRLLWDMTLPARNVFLHHTVTTPTDFPYRDARDVERIGIRRFGRISYSYLVHPSGVILEGAGTKIGAHTANNNSTAFGIGLIGSYIPEVPGLPPPEMVEATRWLVYHLKHERNWLNDSAVLTPHQAVADTRCPGEEVMAIINQFRNPWEPPTPPPNIPPIVEGPTVEVDMRVQHITLNFALDSNGNGWLRIPYPIETVLSATPHSGTRPGADGFYDPVPDQVGLTPEGEDTIVVVRGGSPGGSAPVWVKVVV